MRVVVALGGNALQRRVAPSPVPQRIFERLPIRWPLGNGAHRNDAGLEVGGSEANIVFDQTENRPGHQGDCRRDTWRAGSGVCAGSLDSGRYAR